MQSSVERPSSDVDLLRLYTV